MKLARFLPSLYPLLTGSIQHHRKRRLREDQNLWAASAPPRIGSSPESEPPTPSTGDVDGGAGDSDSADGFSKAAPFDFQFGLSRRFGGFNGRTRNGLVTSIGGYVKTVAP
ncbi:hypothetical protein V6N12_061752 [Hibiscus sabdariffa]|uniref:Glycine-rich protein n=1 Tax=Hibiscus sabdariffa TaxID=183260 RepID=A0ABR2DXZ6_9ROSI